MMRSSIALMIQQKAQEHPDKIALYVKEESCTYGYLAQMNRKAALWLKKKEIQAGDRVIVEADHTLDYVYFWYGIQLLGATFVPLEKDTPSGRIREIANELDATAVVTLTPRADMEDVWNLQDIMPEILEEADTYEPEEVDSENLSEILFTTGTTGKSKGVMVTYANQINIALAGIETTNIQPDNVWLIPTPMNHAAGLRKVHIAMAVGSTVSLLEGFRNVKKYFQTIRDQKVTSLYLPPSAIHMLLMLASRELEEVGKQLRFIYSSSAAYPEVDKEKMRKLLPHVYMYNCFGSSEVGVACTDEFCVSGGSSYVGSVGRPNSLCQILILDENKNEIKNSSSDNVGLVAIKSKSVTKGYWNEPEQTAQAFQGDMLIMSDLGYFAPNGELILVGRSNDTINLGGFKIAPTEVEELVRRVPFVDECLLIPVTRGGNISLKLLVVLKDGMELEQSAIQKIISDNLEPYKMPKQIVAIEEIIKTFNGKIDRKKMIELYQ